MPDFCGVSAMIKTNKKISALTDGGKICNILELKMLREIQQGGMFRSAWS